MKKLFMIFMFILIVSLSFAKEKSLIFNYSSFFVSTYYNLGIEKTLNNNKSIEAQLFYKNKDNNEYYYLINRFKKYNKSFDEERYISLGLLSSYSDRDNGANYLIGLGPEIGYKFKLNKNLSISMNLGIYLGYDFEENKDGNFEEERFVYFYIDPLRISYGF